VTDGTADKARQLRAQLRDLGLSDAAIRAAWPKWWSEEADASTSARADLWFTVARRLGLDPRSLFDEGSPRFLWREEARFKHLSGEGDVERAGITSFGRAVASLLVAATPSSDATIRGASAQEIRRDLLGEKQAFVGLLDLLALSWGVGVPVVHLRVFPWPQKRMAAMTASVGESCAILLGKDSLYPAPISFYLAHELGHIALDHVASDRLIVDLENANLSLAANDDEEQAADRFALEVLTGGPEIRVLPDELSAKPSASELARVALSAASSLAIEPGVLAQCFGFSTGDWQTATGALKVIYSKAMPVWQEVNQLAREELRLDQLSADSIDFLGSVLGKPLVEPGE
jgi:Zn-dependent peptidase ImmA (M78 family)